MNNTKSLPNLKFLESSKLLYVKEITAQAFISPEVGFEEYLAHSWLLGQFSTDRAKGRKVFITKFQCMKRSLHLGQQSKLSYSHHPTRVALLIQIIEREISLVQPRSYGSLEEKQPWLQEFYSVQGERLICAG